MIKEVSKMKAIQCELCGSNQLIKKDGFFQCEYCGTKYTPEEAKKLVLSGSVEIYKGDIEKERNLVKVRALLQQEDYYGAINLLENLIKDYPDDYKLYLQEVELELSVEEKEGSAHPTTIYHCQKYINLASTINPEFDENCFWRSYVEKHGKKLHVIEALRIRKDEFPVTVLSGFDESLICCDYNKLNAELKDLQTIISQEYANRFLKGELFIFAKGKDFWGDYYDRNKKYLSYNNPIMQNLYTQGFNNAEKLQSEECLSFCPTFVLGKLFVWFRSSDYDYVYYYHTDLNKKEIESKMAEMKNRVEHERAWHSDYWKSKNLCRKCGGQFIKKGFFKYICSECGGVKDY